MKKWIKVLLIAAVVLGLTACSSNDTPTTPETEVTLVKVGVVGSYNDQWNTVNELLKAENIQVELVYFNDYATPNRALNEGDVDLNAFQHYAYLEKDIADNGYEIVAIGDTLIAPLAMFNNKSKIESVEEIQAGDVIAIPSDATNGGRALKILEEIGFIECDPEVGLLPTVADIVQYKVEIKIIELESAMLANALPDVTAALINGGNAFTAGLNPKDDAIYIETVGDNVQRLKNLIACRTSEQDNDIFKKIVEAYQSDEVAQTLSESYDGAFIPAWK